MAQKGAGHGDTTFQKIMHWMPLLELPQGSDVA
jgi:hypothetical protein